MDVGGMPHIKTYLFGELIKVPKDPFLPIFIFLSKAISLFLILYKDISNMCYSFFVKIVAINKFAIFIQEEDGAKEAEEPKKKTKKKKGYIPFKPIFSKQKPKDR